MSDTLHLHTLAGCAPTPLAHYLKALGILRLLAEQTDPSARGWWEGDRFRLATRLDRDALERFFLYEYQPTPLIAPWNKESGCWGGSRTDVLTPLRQAPAERFSQLRKAINTSLDAITLWEDCPDPKTKQGRTEKAALIRRCRRLFTGEALRWLDATVALTEADDYRTSTLLGQGGVDMRREFGYGFATQLPELFELTDNKGAPTEQSTPLLAEALYGDTVREVPAKLLAGHFNPAAIKGPNNTPGFQAEATTNPWNYVLALEGVVAFTASVTRRLNAQRLPSAAAPFTTRGTAAGYGTTAQQEGGAAGEFWMPLWAKPAAWVEINHLLVEGRAQLSPKRSHRGKRQAEDTLDFARAVALRGTARGIERFERFGSFPRSGDRYRLAAPLGRWDVPTQPTPHADLLDDVAEWVSKLRQAAKGDTAPKSLGRVARRCEEAMLACCRPSSGGGDPRRWRALLLALGEAEAQLVRSPGTTAGARLQPLPRLRPQWIAAAMGAGEAADRELRLALAVAGLHGYRVPDNRPCERSNRMPHGRFKGASRPCDPIRRHLLPLDEAALRKGQFRFAATERTLHKDPAVVVAGLDAEADLIAVLRRRVMEAGRGEADTKHLPLRPARGLFASPNDLAAVVRGGVDLGAVHALARPLMAMNWTKWGSENYKTERRETLRQIAAPRPTADDWGTLGLFGLFKLCHHHAEIEIDKQKFEVSLDPTILPRLLAGDLTTAAERAKRRLRASGLPPVLGRAAGDVVLCRRLAAALVFPLGKTTASTLAGLLTNPAKEKPERDDASALVPDPQPQTEGTLS
jgi:CRISPR-associated protein Csx17